LWSFLARHSRPPTLRCQCLSHACRENCRHTCTSVIVLAVSRRPLARRASLKNMKFYEASPSHDLTYSDVFLVPGRSTVTSRLDVSLATGDGTGAEIPIVSSNMNSVTGPRLAATLA